MKLGALLPGQRRRILGAALFAAVLVPLLSTSSGAVQVCNNSPVTFTPPGSPTAAVLPFAPYPSTINVSGFTGTVTDVNVLLNGFTYPFPEDVDVLLVAPNGTAVLVMSDIGGNNDGVGDPVNNVNLVFDDQAANFAPTDTLLVAGTYRPTDDDDDQGEFVPDHADVFPAPAPAPGGTALSAFNGINPNGTWSLYVVDDDPGPPQPGSFSGWCVDITTSGAGPTTTTTAPTTTTTAPTTTTTAPTTTTTAPTTTTTAPTTTTTRPPTTTTTRPATTTTTTTPGPVGACGGRTPTIVGTAGNDLIFGTPGPDVIQGGGGVDVIRGLGGDDLICGGDGADRIVGGDGNDTLNGDAGNDLLMGESGDDTLNGGPDNDRLVGGPGNDLMNGGAGNDQCLGGTGSDSGTGCESLF